MQDRTRQLEQAFVDGVYRSDGVGPLVANAFTLLAMSAQGEREGRNGAAPAGGFSLHAGVDIQPGERAKLERLCRMHSRRCLGTCCD